jgi:hypothetical protein
LLSSYMSARRISFSGSAEVPFAILVLKKVISSKQKNIGK